MLHSGLLLRDAGTMPRCKMIIFSLLWLAIMPQAFAKADFIWGANGHPFTAYQGVSFEQQLDYLRNLGMTSYRVNISSIDNATALRTLVEVAKPRGIEILPVLTPGLDLKKETPEDLYKKARAFAVYLVSRFKDDIRVWELGNELENHAIIQPCEMQDNGVQYNCAWGPAGGVGPLEYFGPRWAKVSAVLKGLSDGTISVDPTIRKAIGTAGWGHVGAFERMRQDGIAWDISVWHFYGKDPEWGFKRVAAFGKPIWVTEFNNPMGSQKGVVQQAAGLKKIMTRIRELQDKYRVEAAHVYELLDETYWAPNFEAFMGLVYLDKNDKGKWAASGPKPGYCAVRTLLRGGYRLAAQSASEPVLPGQNQVQPKGPVPHRQCDLCLFDDRDASPANKIGYSYCLVFGHPADAQGLASRTEELKKGDTIDAMLGSMMQSDEFNQRQGAAGLNNSDYITLIYRLLLDRDPDGQGRHDYLVALDNGDLSRPNLVKTLIRSREFRDMHSVLFR